MGVMIAYYTTQCKLVTTKKKMLIKKIIIGDIHGCSEELLQIICKANFSSGSDELFLTGDVFSRGPDPLGVWKIIVEHQAQMVLGNHDVHLLEQLRLILSGNNPIELKSHQLRTIQQLESVHSEIFDWLSKCPLYIKTEHFLLVHAGINPIDGLDGTSFDEFISIRCWPPKKNKLEGSRWHDFYTKQHPLIIFGHDAPNGLVIKENDNERYLIGLDTGCVYGGKLSAYSIGEDLLIQVESKQSKKND